MKPSLFSEKKEDKFSEILNSSKRIEERLSQLQEY